MFVFNFSPFNTYEGLQVGDQSMRWWVGERADMAGGRKRRLLLGAASARRLLGMLR